MARSIILLFCVGTFVAICYSTSTNLRASKEDVEATLSAYDTVWNALNNIIDIVYPHDHNMGEILANINNQIDIMFGYVENNPDTQSDFFIKIQDAISLTKSSIEDIETYWKDSGDTNNSVVADAVREAITSLKTFANTLENISMMI